MASRYDQHAQLIEERFQRGESFTSIARDLHEHFAIPQDASGLRRWILRRIAKREQRLAILSPTRKEENSETVPAARDSSTRHEDISHDQIKGENKEPPKKIGSLSSLILETKRKEKEDSLQTYIKP
jgi:hypothetical protein